MNYYPHHIGDYRAATAHLSNEEDLAYRRLLEMYYDTEAPIPLETQWVSRRLRLGSQVVEAVLHDFFVEQEDGWHHTRCDAEIAEYRAQAEKNRTNGKKGGRPKSSMKTAKTKPNKNPVGSQPVASGNPVATDWQANQEPVTSNQEPEPREKPLSGKGPTLRDEALGILDYLNLKADRHYQPVDQNVGLILDRLKAGATPEQCRFVIDNKCLQWQTDPKMNEYLRPATLFNATKFAQYAGEPMRQPVRELPPNRLGKAGQETAAAAERLMARYASQGVTHETE